MRELLSMIGVVLILCLIFKPLETSIYVGSFVGVIQQGISTGMKGTNHNDQ
jgi:hypothetical protein